MAQHVLNQTKISIMHLINLLQDILSSTISPPQNQTPRLLTLVLEVQWAVSLAPLTYEGTSTDTEMFGDS